MLEKIILGFIFGLLAGYLLEFTYRSLNARRVVIPKLINTQMYASTGAFLFFLYLLDFSIIYKIILILVFPTFVEFITGYLYLKIKGIYLWDYSKEFLNFKGLVCPLFSIYWFILGLISYYFLIPILI